VKKKERLELVRNLLEENRQMTLEEISRHCGVSLRTTYRDLHALLHRTDMNISMNVR